MKKLVLVAVIGAAGFFAYTRFLRPEKHACSQLADLCGASDDKGTQCEDTFVKLRQANVEAANSSTRCLADAKSCPEALGCMAGATAKVGVGAVKDFLNGVGKSLNDK